MPPNDQLPPPLPAEPNQPPVPQPPQTPPPPLPPASPTVPPQPAIPLAAPPAPVMPPTPQLTPQPGPTAGGQPPGRTAEENRQAASARLSPIGKRLFQYIEFDADETLLAEIRKHPIGLLFIVFLGSFIAIIVAVAVTLLAVNLDSLGFDIGSDADTVKSALIVLGLLVSLLCLIMTFVMAFIYRSNVVFVTNEKIAEVVYKSIFNREVTQLGIGSVENVSILQKGILPRLFNYGTLLVETAGETQNVTLTYVPNPSHYSQIIIQAHEESIKQYGN